jgi:two-component system phosphate regulon sensor histidine kinase PhoR
MDEVRQNRAAGFKELKLDYPKERYLSVRVSPLFYREGELSGYIALFHDTTQMKRLEETRKDFVANVSHEIKTPVTAIQGFAETLLDGALDDREHAENFLRTIKSHSERLNRLVDDLLTLSKIELGAIRIDKTNVNISDIVDSVLETLRPGAESKGLVLTKALKADELEIFANRDRTIQILLNLVDNAIKFTETGSVEIGSGKKEERLYLYVKDGGIGIPKRYLFRLGERFFRVDPSRSRALGGTGLGLAIVKHLVRAQGWEMQIESEEGKGTTVRVYVS